MNEKLDTDPKRKSATEAKKRFQGAVSALSLQMDPDILKEFPLLSASQLLIIPDQNVETVAAPSQQTEKKSDTDPKSS